MWEKYDFDMYHNNFVEEAIESHFLFGAFVTLLGMSFGMAAYFLGWRNPEAYVVSALVVSIAVFAVGTGIRSDIR